MANQKSVKQEHSEKVHLK